MQVPYLNVVGNLMYAMIRTKFDISQVISMVNRYMHNSNKRRWLSCEMNSVVGVGKIPDSIQKKLGSDRIGL